LRIYQKITGNEHVKLVFYAYLGDKWLEFILYSVREGMTTAVMYSAV